MEEPGGCKSVDISPPSCLREQKDPRGCLFTVVFPSPRPGALLARCLTARDCPWVRARFIFTAASRRLAHALGLQSPTPAHWPATATGQQEAPRHQPGAHAGHGGEEEEGLGTAGSQPLDLSEVRVTVSVPAVSVSRGGFFGNGSPRSERAAGAWWERADKPAATAADAARADKCTASGLCAERK